MSSVADTGGAENETLPEMVDTSKALSETYSHCREGRLPSKEVAKMQKVFVIDAEGKPCLPCHPARARKLLKERKAVLHSVEPFTVKLNRTIDNPVGELTVGIDDGAKEVGISVVNEHTREIVFKGNIRLRQDVHKKMLQRMQYRRTRRNRKVRYREARFDNRKQLMPPPTIRTKKDSIVRVIADLKTRANIVRAIVEQGQFDTSSLAKDRELEGIEYQHSDYQGKNFRAKVLWRDGYTCQHCNAKDELHVHHIKSKSHGGTDAVSNGITLCDKCHEDLHKGLWHLDKRPKQFKYPAHLQAGKWHLYNKLRALGLSVTCCFGWMTRQWRQAIGLAKTHINDAVSMVCRNYMPVFNSKEYTIIPKRKKVWEDNPTKTCSEKNGFKHWDLIKASHRTMGTVVGSIRSLKVNSITLRTNFDNNFPVSYNKSKVLWRFNGIVYA